MDHTKDRILVPVVNFRKGGSLVKLSAILAQASEDTGICVFNVMKPAVSCASSSPSRPVRMFQAGLPAHILREAQRRNVPLYMKVRENVSVAGGILDEIETNRNIKFVLAGWPDPLDRKPIVENPVKVLLEKAQTNILVLLNRDLGKLRNILVPIGGGVHSRLALRLAYEIADQENAHITVLHTTPRNTEAEEVEDQDLYLREIVVDELGFIPVRLFTRVARSDSVIRGILAEIKRQSYDLLVMGASEEYGFGTRLFGSVDDWVVEHVKECSSLLVRRYEPVPLHWLRRQIKLIEKEY